MDAVENRQPIFDRSDQLEQIKSGLMAGEQLFAVYDGKGVKTGFLALTDKRIIIQNKSYVGKKIAMISLPYSRIAEVGVLSNASFMGGFFSTSEIYVRTFGGDLHEIEFRGVEKGEIRPRPDPLLHHQVDRDLAEIT
jgi:hypothetical protein